MATVIVFSIFTEASENS